MLGSNSSVIADPSCSITFSPASTADPTMCSTGLSWRSRATLARCSRFRQRAEQLTASFLARKICLQTGHSLVCWCAICFINFFVQAYGYQYQLKAGHGQGEKVSHLRCFWERLFSLYKLYQRTLLLLTLICNFCCLKVINWIKHVLYPHFY
jgi:hypothetical protein